MTIDQANASAAVVLEGLQASYACWRRVIGAQPTTPDAEVRFAEILRACIAFSGKQVESPDQAHHLHAVLAKGKELLCTALEWDEPIVGRAAAESSPFRGLQWRLVLAWSGLEQIIKKLVTSTNRGGLEPLLANLHLPPFPIIEPPNEKASRLSRWRNRDVGNDSTGINGFLDAESRETKATLRTWLISGEPLHGWADALVLAKVLRHVTAHGALSATKVREWGLAPFFEQLVPYLGIVAAAIFERMVVGCREILGADVDAPVARHECALSLCQPHADAVLQGLKVYEVRTQVTKFIGRVFVYASHSRVSATEEAMLLAQYGFIDARARPLPRGLVLGTVEIYACTREGDVYHWHFRNPERWKRPKLPQRKPQGSWFKPFHRIR